MALLDAEGALEALNMMKNKVVPIMNATLGELHHLRKDVHDELFHLYVSTQQYSLARDHCKRALQFYKRTYDF
jgi:hemolysin-activating ACP:hemolysin acyltransferase